MIRISTPASSANLGPGFDCLGLALDIYNYFDCEINTGHDLLENVEGCFDNDDNLFLKAYRRGCQQIGVNDFVHVRFDCHIPVSRGLGSSAALIIAGLSAASALHKDALSRKQIFRLASETEGHPDNAAPCLYGGMCASMISEDGIYTSRPLPLSDKWRFTVLIPDFEVSTEEARRILPEAYPRKDAAATGAHAIMMSLALGQGDITLLKTAAVDYIHEPYRRKLIYGFEEVKQITQTDRDGVLLISGSGSTCLFISHEDLSSAAVKKLTAAGGHHWQVKTVSPSSVGTVVRRDV